MNVDPKQKTDSFGGVFASWAAPSRQQFSPDTKVLSFMFTFEDALRLKAMLDDAAHWLNRVDRSKAEGKRAALKVNIRLADSRFYAMRALMPVESARLTRQPPEEGEGE